MPTRVLASECMMRPVMTSRLATGIEAGARRETALVRAVVARVGKDDLEEMDFVEAVLEEVLEEGLGLRPLVLVLKGFAMGARLRVPSEFLAILGVECFLVAADSTAYEVRPAATARNRMKMDARRSNIYWTPRGFAPLSG